MTSSVTLMQKRGFVLMSVAFVTTWGPYRCPKSGPLPVIRGCTPSMPIPDPCASTQDHGDFRPRLLPGVMFGPMTLLQLVSELISMTPVATKGRGLKSGPTPEAMLDLEGWTATEATQAWVACTATCSHGVIQSRTVGVGHAWLHGPTVARVCVNTCGSCYPQRLSGIPRVWAATWGHVGISVNAATWAMSIWEICNAN